MYFADPYCAWQKGKNENLNGLRRELQKLVKGKSCDIEKEPGAYKRQAQKGFALPDTARFV